MKVVLKPSILDRIREDLNKARTCHREVSYICVTPTEYDAIRKLPDIDRSLVSAFAFCTAPTVVPADAQFSVWEFVGTGAKRGERLRATTSEYLYGHPLLVVPAEFHPQ